MNENMQLDNKEGDLPDFVGKMAGEFGFSGVIRLSRPGGMLYEEAFGSANRDWNIPNRIDTRFNTASISKVFTACGILKLAEKGLLKLDDRLAEHLKFEGEPFSRDITLYHLLTHSSGIADDADEEAGENYEDIFIDKPNYSFRRATDLVRNFIGKKPVFSPGGGCRYNNAAYVLLGLVIEKITGIEYKQWLAENILAPWGLENTFFSEMDRVNSNTAEGYIEAGEGSCKVWKKNIYSIPPVGTPEGGIYSTAGDLHLLLSGLTEGRFLRPDITKLILTPKVLHSDYGSFQHRMGFGFEFYMDGNRVLWIQKDGSNPGVSAVMAYYPDMGASLVILSNMNCDVWTMKHRLEKGAGLVAGIG
ncbi:MAG TPA: serine hydrolase domain-containing protein [Clostridia bacterium]|nr:serine hydrolase domain-containing protein [Clostridia bacterium]